MKKFLEYFSGVLYSVKECMKTWKMPKKYPIIVFIISFFMLLSPIQFNMYSTPSESLINQIPHINDVLKDVAIDLNNQGINVEIKDNKIQAASCILPLTDKESLDRIFGTRHRAAIGISEESDCVSLIVSEETGRISMAINGDLSYNLSSKVMKIPTESSRLCGSYTWAFLQIELEDDKDLPFSTISNTFLTCIGR